MNWSRLFTGLWNRVVAALRFCAPYVRRGFVATITWLMQTFFVLPAKRQLSRFQKWFAGVAPLIIGGGFIFFLMVNDKTELLNVIFVFGLAIFFLIFGIRTMFKGLPKGRRGRRR